MGGDSRIGGYAAVPDRPPGDGPASPTSALVVSQPDTNKSLQLAKALDDAAVEEEVINYRVLCHPLLRWGSMVPMPLRRVLCVEDRATLLDDYPHA